MAPRADPVAKRLSQMPEQLASKQLHRVVASATRPHVCRNRLLYPRASSPLTENFPGAKLARGVAKSVADGVKSLTCRVFAACYEMRRGSVPGRKRRRVRTSSLGRVPLVGEDKAESPGFVRLFNEKMELADIEIAAWRGDISSASSVVPLIVQTKKGRCHGTTEHL